MEDHSVSIVLVEAHKKDNVPKEESLAEDGELLRLRSKQIPRFPSSLSRIGRERDYIAPRTVALGPYYHGVPELEAMEEVKRTVADYYFFQGLDQSRQETFDKIKSIALNVRCCYTDKDAVEGITDDKFAEIMFIDSCFLVQFIDTRLNRSKGAALRSIINPHTSGVFRDMMLLENQIPWAVMEALMDLKGLKMDDIISFLVDPLHGLVDGSKKLAVHIDKKDYKPSHLLCLVRFFEASRKTCREPSTSDVEPPVPVCTSAVELTQIGITLEASREMRFSAMDMVRCSCSAKLVLAPLQVGPTVHCWLVNLAAFEMWAETSWDESPVNSHLILLALLMNREADVRELRAKRIVHGVASDRQTLEFFNDLAPDLCNGRAYRRLMVSLEEYRQKRWWWIAVYRFAYKHANVIATVLPIVSVLVGILKAILSLKH